MFDDIVKAVTGLSTKGVRLNIGFTDDSYWKIGAMVIGVVVISVGLRYIVFGNNGN